MRRVVFWLLLASVGCKQQPSSTGGLKNADHLDPGYTGEIVLTPGSPQSPDPAQCKTAVGGAPKDGLHVDLAWQFPDVKKQEYGDCYVFAAIAEVESALGRRYKRKPQISLSEQFAVISTFLDKDAFDRFKDRWIDPFRSGVAEGEYTNEVVSGGFGEWIVNHLGKNPGDIVLADEFSYEEMKKVIGLIRYEILQAKPRGGVRFADVEAILQRLETHFGVRADPASDDTSGGAQPPQGTSSVGAAMQPIFRALRGYFATRSTGQDPTAFRKILEGHLATKLRPGAVAQALAALGNANFKDLTAQVPIDAAYYQAEKGLIDAYAALAEQELAKSGRYLPDPWTVFGGAGTPDSETIKEPGVPQPAPAPSPDDVRQQVASARGQCAKAATALRDAIMSEVCQGYPVLVSGHIQGMWTVAADQRLANAVTTIYWELQDWAAYLQFMAEQALQGSPSPAPPSPGFNLSSSAARGYPDLMDFSVFKRLMGPSRGNADLDPRRDATVREQLHSVGRHAAHAMVIDGIETIRGETFWRLRNSWGGSGSAYIPMNETCRFFTASVLE